MTGFGRERGLKMFADWTNAIAAGEVPTGAAASQGHGAQRRDHHVELGRQRRFVHDEIATDKRNPRRQSERAVYGVDIGNDYLLIVDPVNHWSELLRLPTRRIARIPSISRRQVPAVSILR